MAKTTTAPKQASIGARPTKNISLVIKPAEGEEIEYNRHCSSFVVTPTQNQLTWKGGTEDAVLRDVAAPEWAAAAVMVQDVDNTESLFNLMLDHAGEKATIRYMPNSEGKFAREIDVTLVAPAWGGEIGAYATATCTMPVEGQPRKPEAAAAPEAKQN